MAVVDVFDREMLALGVSVEDSALAAAARTLAVDMDAARSVTARSLCMKAFGDALRELRASAPPKEVRDDLTELRESREKRRARQSASEGSASS